MTSDPGNSPIAYSISEACRVSSLGRTFIFAAIRDNLLATRKVGRRRLILADSLRTFIENREAA